MTVTLRFADEARCRALLSSGVPDRLLLGVVLATGVVDLYLAEAHESRERKEFAYHEQIVAAGLAPDAVAGFAVAIKFGEVAYITRLSTLNPSAAGHLLDAAACRTVLALLDLPAAEAFVAYT